MVQNVNQIISLYALIEATLSIFDSSDFITNKSSIFLSTSTMRVRNHSNPTSTLKYPILGKVGKKSLAK